MLWIDIGFDEILSDFLNALLLKVLLVLFS